MQWVKLNTKTIKTLKTKELAAMAKKAGNPQVKNFIKELDTILWFKNVGKSIHSQEVKQLFSWNDAWEHLQNENWINASFHKHVDSMNLVWDIAYDQAFQAASKSIDCHKLEEGISVADAVAYDAAAAAVEIVTQSTDTFFIKLMEWYRLGHFPCGWEGEYPEGKLIIY
ncbi:hypothetical protein [Iningainema tapete]|nr:hypothetical protein [Iningainema tapete]